MANEKKTPEQLQFPSDLKYYIEHTWTKAEGDAVVVGITDFAQDQLGEIIFIELPQIGAVLKKGQEFGSAESVKTVSALYMPVSGKIVAVNGDLNDCPDLVNHSPYEAGWMIRVEALEPQQLEELLSNSAYVVSLKK